MSENRILYEDTRERFRAYACAVRPEQDMKPYPPFLPPTERAFLDAHGAQRCNATDEGETR